MIATAPPISQTLTIQWPPEIRAIVTLEEFAALVEANPELQFERTATGGLIVTPPTGSETGKRNFRLNIQFGKWFEAHPELGEGFDSSTGFCLPNGANRSPDLAWVARSRWESLTPEEREGFAPLCPDFVMELRSPLDQLDVLQAKLTEYIDNGARLGWLIDPQNQQVWVYRPGQEVDCLDQPVELSGEDVLPGFILPLARIW
ncbi:MAG: Uma2 family endonuclease [Spirulina sp. DLM2.Bin59]|nr:MAG: Uma2 family endonuclease [Spirulina sp. DLM2.Bin59]